MFNIFKKKKTNEKKKTIEEFKEYTKSIKDKRKELNVRTSTQIINRQKEAYLFLRECIKKALNESELGLKYVQYCDVPEFEFDNEYVYLNPKSISFTDIDLKNSEIDLELIKNYFVDPMDLTLLYNNSKVNKRFFVEELSTDLKNKINSVLYDNCLNIEDVKIYCHCHIHHDWKLALYDGFILPSISIALCLKPISSTDRCILSEIIFKNRI